MSAVDLVLTGALLLMALGLSSILFAARPMGSTIVYASAGVLSALVALVGLATLVAGAGAGMNVGASTLWLPIGLPWIGAHFRVDALAAFFVIVVGFGSSIISFYSIGYGRHEHEPWRVLPFYPSFIGAMLLVVIADDAFSFLLSWEVMSLLSWALVLTHHRESAVRSSGLVYLIMAAFGTMSLILAFGLLAGPLGAYDFQSMRASGQTPLVGSVVVILMLLGAGSKAGIVPLHIWLPLAHPAAPSHVSAMMSGIMTKVAIYGFIRVTFDLLGGTSWWMSEIVLAVGAVTAVMGVLYALMQHDLKRLLAYHTVENIGIIFIGLGLAMAFRHYDMNAAAALAMVAALFHIFNHSVFKNLLFLGAGAVQTATGSRDMEKMGGLIHRMPVTSLLFLVASVAISALPPFNGFVSEWLTFQAILLSPDLPDWGLKILTPGVGGMLALAAALAAACFVKVYGVVFLGRARSEVAKTAREVDRWSLATMSVLALVCLLAGVFPGVIIDTLSPVSHALVQATMPVQSADPWMTITPVASGRSSYNGVLVLLFVTMSGFFAAWVIHRFASRSLRRAPAWDCGFELDDPSTQYGAASFAQPIRRTFGTKIFSARESVTMPPPGSTAPAKFSVSLRDPVWDGFFARVSGAVTWLADKANRLQFLTIRQYLSVVFAALVLLLLVLTLWK